MKARREPQRTSRVVEMSAPYATSNNTRLYVGNLSWEVTWQDLKDHMRTSGGRVVRCDVLQESSGRSKGCGIVEFSSAREAADAIDKLNDSELKGRKIFIREDREDKAPASTGPVGGRGERNSGSTGGATTVTVENLPPGFAWQDLKDLMKSAGFVVRADVINNDDNTTGTVEFRNASDVTNAIKQYNRATVNDFNIRVFPKGRNNNVGSSSSGAGDRKRSGGNSGNKRLYVGQLAWGVTWQSLKDHFKQAGNVLHADVMTEDGSTRSKGYGFVEFASDEEAQHAIDMLNDSELEGRKIYVREDRESR